MVPLRVYWSDRGFAKVETINLAYQEASVLVAYLVETHGDEKLRADFYDRPLHYPELGALMDAHSVSILPMALA